MKMRKKGKKIIMIMKIPIFENEVYIRIGDTQKDFLMGFRLWCGDEEIEGSDQVNQDTIAWVVRGKNSGLVGAWFEKKSLSVFVHEAVHIANYIMKTAGIKGDVENDEVCAYLVEYLYEQFRDKLKIRE